MHPVVGRHTIHTILHLRPIRPEKNPIRGIHIIRRSCGVCIPLPTIDCQSQLVPFGRRAWIEGVIMGVSNIVTDRLSFAVLAVNSVRTGPAAMAPDFLAAGTSLGSIMV